MLGVSSLTVLSLRFTYIQPGSYRTSRPMVLRVDSACAYPKNGANCSCGLGQLHLLW